MQWHATSASRDACFEGIIGAGETLGAKKVLCGLNYVLLLVMSFKPRNVRLGETLAVKRLSRQGGVRAKE
jgi:hypothetical protein